MKVRLPFLGLVERPEADPTRDLSVVPEETHRRELAQAAANNRAFEAAKAAQVQQRRREDQAVARMLAQAAAEDSEG